MTYNSFARENETTNRWKFQSQEHVDELDLGWDSFKWRNYDPMMGRFFNVDPLATKYVYNSPYAFSENHVTSHVELEGLEKYPINPSYWQTAKPVSWSMEGFRQYFQGPGKLIDKAYASVSATVSKPIGELKAKLGLTDVTVSQSLEKTTTYTVAPNWTNFWDNSGGNTVTNSLFSFSSDTQSNLVTEFSTTTKVEAVDVQTSLTTQVNTETGAPSLSTGVTVGAGGTGVAIDAETTPNSTKVDVSLKVTPPSIPLPSGSSFKLGLKIGFTPYEEKIEKKEDTDGH